jgi:hypothetical protein
VREEGKGEETVMKTAKAQRDHGRPKQRELPTFPNRGEAGLCRRDIAALLRITTRTLDKMIGSGLYPGCDFRVPDPQKGDPRWRVATHDAWVRRQAGIEEPDSNESEVPKRKPGDK